MDLKRDTRQSGFTLAELLVVIALIGLLTTLVVINFRRGNYSNDLRQAGTELLQNLRLAQQYTIGGNSILLCSDNSGVCPTQGDVCNVNTGALCRLGVPQGGYGIHIGLELRYVIFGDINQNEVWNSDVDANIIEKQINTKNIRITAYKLDNQDSVNPNPAAPLDIVFEPPQGTVHFITLDSQGDKVDNTNVTEARILLRSDNISTVCRLVRVNRISGQIAESQTDCSL